MKKVISGIYFLVYDISYKTLFISKSWHVRFDEVDGFIRVYDRIRYSTLLPPEKTAVIYNRISYLGTPPLQKKKIIITINNNNNNNK